MRLISKIFPAIKLTARLSSNTSNRRYTSLVQVLQKSGSNQNVLKQNSLAKRFFETDRPESTNKGLIESIKNGSHKSGKENIPSTILPVALIDLSPLSNNSTKVLLIPLNWQEANEYSLRNTITSIFSKPKTLQKIEAFSKALKEVPAYQTDRDMNEEQSNGMNIQKVKVNNTEKNNSNSAKKAFFTQKSVKEDDVTNTDSLDRLAATVDKTLQQCCLNSMQIYADNNLLGVTIEGLKFPPVLPLTDKAHLSESVSSPSSLNIDMSNINLKDISWHQRNPFSDIQNSSLSNVMLPITLNKKSFSTKSKATDNTQDFKIQNAVTVAQLSKAVTLTICRKASNSTRTKCIANYDFPYLAKLFGNKELLMSCDAYNQSLIEAAKRRAALAECAAKSNEIENSTYKRPQVTSIKGCSAPIKEFKRTLQPASCPPPSKPKLQASGDCKKDDPCKPPECPNPCKEELEKMERLKEQEIKKHKNKMPTGCESPKCKKDDKCKNSSKSPCKKASNQNITQDTFSAETPTMEKQMSSDCKKEDPCKTPQCSNPCKEEKEKLKRQTEEEIKRKQRKIPTGCISPKCKKEDKCTKLKEKPSKTASDKDSHGLVDSQSSLKCAKKSDSKGKSDSYDSTKDKKQKNPCLDEHTEYKPKCNIDPCQKDGNPCSGAKKAPSGKSDKKNADSCGGCGKKDDPCKKKNNPCDSKKKDPCKKEKPSPCGKRKIDPAKKKKDDLCKKKKEDPCKKKKEDPCKKKTDDPCKKEKYDPCKKKKEDPCKKKKEDPCKKKTPCGGKKEDPCKKEKEDPCKKKKSSPCVSDKKKDDSCSKKPSSPCKSKKDSKKQTCGKSKASTKPNCGKNKKCYSTSTTTLNKASSGNISKRTFSSLSGLPSLRNKNFYTFGFMRHYSSKKGGSKKKSEDLGRSSQCKTVATNVPPKRKTTYNPHPKDGLRVCYPTYDMDCKKLCKDARKTDCNKYAFLKDTDNNKRNRKK